jgi:hypothetical protein
MRRVSGAIVLVFFSINCAVPFVFFVFSILNSDISDNLETIRQHQAARRFNFTNIFLPTLSTTSPSSSPASSTIGKKSHSQKLRMESQDKKSKIVSSSVSSKIAADRRPSMDLPSCSCSFLPADSHPASTLSSASPSTVTALALTSPEL